MTKIILTLIVIISLFTSCKKNCKEMIVVKDCTGTYLRYNDEDHLICNENMLDSYNDGTLITATIKIDNNCNSDRIHCMMLHHYKIANNKYIVSNIK